MDRLRPEIIRAKTRIELSGEGCGRMLLRVEPGYPAEPAESYSTNPPSGEATTELIRRRAFDGQCDFLNHVLDRDLMLRSALRGWGMVGACLSAGFIGYADCTRS